MFPFEEMIDTGSSPGYSKPGKTTRLIAHGIEVASKGTVEKFPAWWRYFLGLVLGVVTLGFFKYEDYLERHAKRRIWNVVFVVHAASMISTVQKVVAEMIKQKGSPAIFQKGGSFIDFGELPHGGTFRIASALEVERTIRGRFSVYLIVDHYALEQGLIPEYILEEFRGLPVVTEL